MALGVVISNRALVDVVDEFSRQEQGPAMTLMMCFVPGAVGVVQVVIV